MKRLIGMLVIALLGVVLVLRSGYAQETPSAEEIIKKANQAVFFGGRDASCDVEMTVLGSYTQEQNWRFKITRLTKDNTGEQKFLVVFQNPGFMKNVSYMVWKRPGQEDVSWISIPVMDFLRRIELDKERAVEFFGTNLRYEDWSGRNPDADRYEMIDDNGTGHYLIKAVPKQKKDAGFDYYLVWIRKLDYVPVKIEFYNRKDTLLRLIEVLDTENIEGYPTVTRALIKDLQNGGESTFHFTNIAYNTGLNEDVTIEINQSIPLRY